MANTIDFTKVIEAGMKLPIVHVDRKAFLTKELSKYYDEATMQEIINKGTKGFVDKRIIDKVARGCINYQTTIVCSVSAVAGIPGGWALLGAVPADIAQFYANTISLVQKMLYLYGWPDFNVNNDELDDDTTSIIILWIGVMMGANGAEVAVRQIAKQLAVGMQKRIARMTLGTSALYQVAKKVCAWLGIQLTRETSIKVAGKVVPIIGAPISAAVSYATFYPMARKLKRELDNQWNKVYGI